MPKGDVKTFKLHYDGWRADRLPAGFPKAFEFFGADQFLKERALSDKEILAGQVDASEDGGVDSFYAFHNGLLIDDNTKVDARAGGDLELKIIQSKEKQGFSPTSINKFGHFIEDLLSLNRQVKDFKYDYHDKLTRLMELFRNIFRELQTRSSPRLFIEFFFISGLDVEPNRNAKKSAEHLLANSTKYYSDTTVLPFQFINVAALWTQFQVAPPKKRLIKLENNFGTKEGWVALVTLKNYYEFLKDAKLGTDGLPKIDDHIFDSNVRGYQEKTRVNKRIAQTLAAADSTDPDEKPPEFWQLNNGITILSSSITYSDELLSIDNPQIVNGLQTSRRIFDYCKGKEPFPEADTRRILIRAIKTADEDTRSDIIRATNDQNPMPPEAFLSTLRIQHQIETWFLKNGLYYDRRKGHYKSENAPLDKIVGIVELMQAMIAIVLRKPDYARGRPRDFLKEKKRQRLFGADDNDSADESEPLDLDLYVRCVQITRRVDAYLAMLALDENTALNLKFFIALDATAEIIKNAHMPPKPIIEIDVDRDFTDALLKASYQRVRRLYRSHGGDDDAAKGPKAMVKGLLTSLQVRHSPSNKSLRRKARR